MRNDPDARITDAELEASLERLGVSELEERMELSPLLADAGIGETDGCNCSCSCDVVPREPDYFGEFDPYIPTTADTAFNR